jgi:hypothetical protein
MAAKSFARTPRHALTPHAAAPADLHQISCAHTGHVERAAVTPLAVPDAQSGRELVRGNSAAAVSIPVLMAAPRAKALSEVERLTLEANACGNTVCVTMHAAQALSCLSHSGAPVL